MQELIKALRGALAGLLADDSGAAALEYGLLVALISGALIVTATVLGTEINNFFVQLVADAGF